MNILRNIRTSGTAVLIASCALVASPGCGDGSHAMGWSGGAGDAGSPEGGGTGGEPGDPDDAGAYGTGAEGGVTDGGGGPVLLLPIEVLGSGAPDDPAVTATALPLQAADIASVQSLYVQCHRCGFYDPPEFEALAKPLTKVKASLRMVGGGDGADASSAPWIDVTNTSVQVDPVALAHGGINGALLTLGFHVAIDDATRARLVGGPGATASSSASTARTAIRTATASWTCSCRTAPAMR